MGHVDTDFDVKTDIRVNFDKNYQVIMHNDDTTPQFFVAEILESIFKHTPEDAQKLIRYIEKHGSGVVSILPFKLANVRRNKAMDLASDYGFSDFKVELRKED